MAKEGVQNTHHWSGRTVTATMNRVAEAGSCHDCGSQSSVTSLIAQITGACFVHLLLQYFPHAVINWIQV